MGTISLEDAQAMLADLVHRLAPGEGVTITEAGRPVARLVAPLAVSRTTPRPRPPITGVPRAGMYEGRLIVPDDFKEPLEELRDYME